MMWRQDERRRGVRLASGQSRAVGLQCVDCGALPEEALVIDVGEGGLRLLFDWPEGRRFPLRVGEKVGFQLRVEGNEPGFDMHGAVRRIEPPDQDGRVGVSVEFDGLEARARSLLQRSLVAMAMTRLRNRRS